MSFEDIIIHVKNTPSIWQTSHPNHNKYNVLKRVWARMAKDLEVDENLLKKRWKHLKDQYRKEFKKVLATKQTSPDEVEVTWQYYKDLSFLRDEICNRGLKNKAADVQKVSEGSDTDHDSGSETSAPSLKMTKYDDNNVFKNVKNLGDPYIGQDRMDVHLQNDADYLFLMSILPTMKFLTEIQKLQFRGKVNDWLLEAYTKNSTGNEYANIDYSATETDTKEYVHTQINKK